MNEIKFIIFAIGMLIGIVLGEHKTCTELGGSYSWDYGTCKERGKRARQALVHDSMNK